MDLNRFTEKAQQALAGAQKIAARMNHQQIEVEHVLLSLLDQEKGLTPAILEKAGVSVDALTIKAQRELEKLPRVTGPHGAPDQIYVSGRFNKLVAHAEEHRKKLVFAGASSPALQQRGYRPCTRRRARMADYEEFLSPSPGSG